MGIKAKKPCAQYDRTANTAKEKRKENCLLSIFLSTFYLFSLFHCLFIPMPLGSDFTEDLKLQAHKYSYKLVARVHTVGTTAAMEEPPVPGRGTERPLRRTQTNAVLVCACLIFFLFKSLQLTSILTLRHKSCQIVCHLYTQH